MWGIKTMTNREWLLKQMQNMSDEELINTVTICKFINSENCDAEGKGCVECNKNWLKAEHKEKIKLSDAERVILENLPKECKWIFRDLTESLVVCVNKPGKTERYWTTNGIRFLFNAFNHLFKFIKANDTEPYNIEELLKGE